MRLRLSQRLDGEGPHHGSAKGTDGDLDEVRVRIFAGTCAVGEQSPFLAFVVRSQLLQHAPYQFLIGHYPHLLLIFIRACVLLLYIFSVSNYAKSETAQILIISKARPKMSHQSHPNQRGTTRSGTAIPILRLGGSTTSRRTKVLCCASPLHPTAVRSPRGDTFGLMNAFALLAPSHLAATRLRQCTMSLGTKQRRSREQADMQISGRKAQVHPRRASSVCATRRTETMPQRETRRFLRKGSRKALIFSPRTPMPIKVWNSTLGFEFRPASKGQFLPGKRLRIHNFRIPLRRVSSGSPDLVISPKACTHDRPTGRPGTVALGKTRPEPFPRRMEELRRVMTVVDTRRERGGRLVLELPHTLTAGQAEDDDMFGDSGALL